MFTPRDRRVLFISVSGRRPVRAVDVTTSTPTKYTQTVIKH